MREERERERVGEKEGQGEWGRERVRAVKCRRESERAIAKERESGGDRVSERKRGSKSENGREGEI